MKTFRDLSDDDKKRVIAFIEDNIEKHYREHQVYDVQVAESDDDPGIELNEGDEKHEADIEDVWYECTDCDDTSEVTRKSRNCHRTAGRTTTTAIATCVMTRRNMTDIEHEECDYFDGCEYADRCGDKCRGCDICGAAKGQYGIDCPVCKKCRKDHANRFEGR